MKKRKIDLLSVMLRTLVILSAVITLGVLFSLVAYILVKGVPNIRLEMFEWEYTTKNTSMLPAIINTLIMVVISLAVAVPVGVCSAVYMTEYARRGSKFVKLVGLTTETLSGIPSIVYGLFGFLFFSVGLSWGNTLLGGGLTLAIMVLPLIMRTSEEALKSVPDSFREGSFGLGAGKLRTIFKIVLPYATSGIVSGIILAIGRVVGETAALLFTAGSAAKVPDSLMGSGRTLAVHMYCLLSEGLYMDSAYATAVVLIVFVVGINGLSSMAIGKAGKNNG